jgi:hypothetical protein
MQVADHDKAKLFPNHVYVIAPGRKLEITDRSVGASGFEQPRGKRAAIDIFFHSLAAVQGDGFAVVLSGSGSDGALGAKAVKEAGGIVLVQEPADASHGDMPRAVIATGVADIVLAAEALAAQLVELARSKARIEPLAGAADGAAAFAQDEEKALRGVFDVLRKRAGHDFSKYKGGTVLRRLTRRMQLRQRSTIGEYLDFLRADGNEVQRLLTDLLISVTTFFRDPDSWKALRTSVIGSLVQQAGDEPIAPGCPRARPDKKRTRSRFRSRRNANAARFSATSSSSQATSTRPQSPSRARAHTRSGSARPFLSRRSSATFASRMSTPACRASCAIKSYSPFTACCASRHFHGCI